MLRIEPKCRRIGILYSYWMSAKQNDLLLVNLFTIHLLYEVSKHYFSSETFHFSILIINKSLYTDLFMSCTDCFVLRDTSATSHFKQDKNLIFWPIINLEIALSSIHITLFWLTCDSKMLPCRVIECFLMSN